MRYAFMFLFMVFGFFLSWKFWDRFGVKTVLSYYFLRTLGVIIIWTCYYNEIPFDLRGWYAQTCWMVDLGKIPGRDFSTPYNLGFEILLYLAVWIYRSPFSILVLFASLEMCSTYFLYQAFHKLCGEKVAKRSLLLFVTSPICCSSAFFAQDEPIMLLGAGVILWLLVNNKDKLIGIFSILTFFFTKIFSPLYFLSFCLVSGKKTLWTTMIGICVYWGIALLLGINPFDFQFSEELETNAHTHQNFGGMITRGSVWRYLPDVSPTIPLLITAVLLGIVALVFAAWLLNERQARKLRLMYAGLLSGALYLAFNLSYPMNFHQYAVPIIPFVIVVFLERSNYLVADFICLGAWSFVECTVESGASTFARFFVCAVLNVWLLCRLMMIGREAMSVPLNGIVAFCKVLFGKSSYNSSDM